MGLHPIQWLPTSSTVFFGTAAAGKFRQPTRVGSFVEFEQKFGSLTPGRELGYSVLQFFLNGGTDAWVLRVSNSRRDRYWLDSIKRLDAVDLINLVALPGLTAPSIVMPFIEYCVKRRAFLILDSPSDITTPEQIKQWIESNTSIRSPNATVYYPWIKIADPLNGSVPRRSAPSGTIAGLYSRIDSTRGVWKAPAGSDADLVGVQTLDYMLTDAENAMLNPLAINTLRVFPARNPLAWGARTLAGADQLGSEWKYIPVRRLALFLEESIYRGTKWAVFEPNDEPLWAQIRLNVGVFMHDLFHRGAFQGITPKDAYFVKCDKETTTQTDVNQGVVNILVGFAPLKPAEFVVIKIQQIAGQIQT